MDMHCASEHATRLDKPLTRTCGGRQGIYVAAAGKNGGLGLMCILIVCFFWAGMPPAPPSCPRPLSPSFTSPCLPYSDPLQNIHARLHTLGSSLRAPLLARIGM